MLFIHSLDLFTAFFDLFIQSATLCLLPLVPSRSFSSLRDSAVWLDLQRYVSAMTGEDSWVFDRRWRELDCTVALSAFCAVLPI